ncbi:MAG: pentapeptide repeat-containing protein [Candidatus Poribacteria bacterium]|nr:pentapeptide repeat-containing protein [Candidatus Poribacteria bacterium]MDE0506328.1 pentapeptide repeat-containing protein [Candidatus Poribacteria bacterium]
MSRTNLEGADSRPASVCGADLREAELEGAVLEGVHYNSQTQFPDGFDPAGTKMVKEQD